MKKLTVMLTTGALFLLTAAPGTAIDLYPWNNHPAPYTFLFGNDIDLHQQTQQLPDGSLSGFFHTSRGAGMNEVSSLSALTVSALLPLVPQGLAAAPRLL